MFSFFTEPGWMASLIGIVVGGGVLFGIAEVYYRVRHEEGLGMGDVKMLAMIGAFLGWKLTLVTLMMASLSGTVIGAGADRHRPRRHEVRAAVRHVSRAGRRGGRNRRLAAADWYLGFLWWLGRGPGAVAVARVVNASFFIAVGSYLLPRVHAVWYFQFIKPNVLPALTDFVKLTPWLFLVTQLITLLTLMAGASRRTRSRRGA